MDDARFVRGRERIGDLHAEAQCLTDPETFRRNDVIERPTGRVLHHDEIDSRLGTDVVNGDDAWVIQSAGRLGFLNEALFAVGIGHLVGW